MENLKSLITDVFKNICDKNEVALVSKWVGNHSVSKSLLVSHCIIHQQYLYEKCLKIS